jgi:DNA-binding IclR family transcriptional regulator
MALGLSGSIRRAPTLGSGPVAVNAGFRFPERHIRFSRTIIAAMKLVRRAAANVSAIDGDTPALRLLALIEVIASRDQLVSLQGLTDETGLPKPTLHRMLMQLESAGLLQREAGGRHYSAGVRLRRLAENLLFNGSLHGARHAVLRRLVDEVGESCNLTALSGGEVIYLDRVETAAPLRFYLQPGSRVPAHCSASGKVFLAQMGAAQRRRLLAHAPLERYTPKTLVDPRAIEAELAQVRRKGYALDNEEFLPGLQCVAVPVVGSGARSNLAVAVQAPVMRLGADKALQLLPALQRAAAALAEIDAGAAASKRRSARA